MNRFFAVLVICSGLLSVVAISQVAMAQSTMPDSQADLIRQNCTTIQTTLRQLRVSDAGLRTDRGQLYENISTKLMAPLNSRIAMSRLDGLELGSIALNYNKHLDAYREKYQEYERSLSRTIQAGCASEPAKFHELLGATRDLRLELHQETNRLVDLLKDYKLEFEEFVTEIEGGE